MSAASLPLRSSPVASSSSVVAPPAVRPSIDLRGEPFRLFFPLAAALGAGGVACWALYGAGFTTRYLAGFHAVTQAQSFLLAFAAGFLMTAVPKRTRTAPAAWWEIGALAALIPAVSFAELFEHAHLAQVLYVAAIAVLAQFAVRRFLGRAAGRRPPATFVMVPIGLFSGVIGALAWVASERGWLPSGLGALGRSFALEGVFTCLVLGVGGFFFALALRGDPPPDLDKAPGEARKAVLFGLAGVAVLAGLALQNFGQVRAGLLLRAAVAVAVLVSARGHLRPARPGVNRVLVWLSAWAVPAGLVLAALSPDDRVAWMHVVFIGGFGLLAFSVAAHVALGHGGHDAARDGRPWQSIVIGVLFTTAMLLRATATHAASVYFGWLAIAATIWLTAALLWALFLVPKMWSPPLDPAKVGG